MKPIVVVGSINMDLVSRAPHIPKPGETIIGTDFQMHSGGKGANQAVAVARLGYPCLLLGKVGPDLFGQQLLHGLSEYGVDISHVESGSCASGTASIVVEDSGENCIIVTPGANLEVTIPYVERKLEILKSAGFVLAQLEIPLDTIEWLAKTCNRFGVPFMLDPAPARTLPQSLVSQVDWFTPNESEAAFFADGLEDEDAILEKLLRIGVRRIILKCGSRGALLSTGIGGEHQWVKPCVVKARDTTAAGDAFNGAFAVGMMRGLKPHDSAAFATAAAAISVTRHGAQPSMPTQQELEEFLGACSTASPAATA
jgi:ribokinase